VKLVEVARGKVLASGSASNSSTATSSTTGTTTAADAPKYRDRASERRVMHNQPDMPLPEASLGSLNGGGAATGLKGKTAQVPAAPALPPPPIHPGKDENNVGNKLLKMMGWKEGQGLGENGDGRADPM
jgi:RNA-binding protein 5/10